MKGFLKKGSICVESCCVGMNNGGNPRRGCRHWLVCIKEEGCLELEVNGEADAVLLQFVASVDVGHIVVGESAYILDGDDLEDVADADGEFHVGFVAHDEGGLSSVSCGEDEEVGIVGVLKGVVAVGKVCVEHLESDVFTQFEFLEQRDTVENLSVEVPVDA